MSADDFLKVQRDIADARTPRRKHPTGWEPGIDTSRGVLTVEAGDTPPQDWAEIIRELGLDPAAWTVDESPAGAGPNVGFRREADVLLQGDGHPK
jgi:hypothetical protein